MHDLARKYDFVRFVKLSCEEAEMDRAAIPAILAYKNGDLFANLVSVVDEIPPHMELNTSSLEAVLARYFVRFFAILNVTDQCIDAISFNLM